LDEIASTLQLSTQIELWESSTLQIGTPVPMNVGELTKAALEIGSGC
jgi:hypothetical protein